MVCVYVVDSYGVKMFVIAPRTLWLSLDSQRSAMEQGPSSREHVSRCWIVSSSPHLQIMLGGVLQTLTWCITPDGVLRTFTLRLTRQTNARTTSIEQYEDAKPFMVTAY